MNGTGERGKSKKQQLKKQQLLTPLITTDKNEETGKHFDTNIRVNSHT